MYKVDSILKHTQVMSMRTWRLGRDISGDEQTNWIPGEALRQTINYVQV